MSYLVYKIVHYLGVFTAVTTAVALLSRAARPDAFQDPWRKRMAVFHGIGLFLVLLGGFGMLARLGLGMGGWVWAKVAIWVIFGALLAVAKRSSVWSARWVVMVPLLAALAGILAFTKPF